MKHSELLLDTYRQCSNPNWRKAITKALSSRTFRPIFTMRLCQVSIKSRGLLRLMFPFFRVLHRWSTQSAAMDLPWKTKIGGGLAIAHGWGVVVNQGATIGSNVTIFHGVTLGQRDRISSSGERFTEYPKIEDEVWLGPNAIIVGGITIGRGSRIAGGAFVTESIPPYSVVSGNPAKIVRENCTPDVMKPAPVQA